MKKFIAFIAAASMMLCAFSTGSQAKSKATRQEVVFATTIDCPNCVKKVVDNISFEKGVLDLDVKLEEKTVKIVYNPSKTDPDKLAAAIRKLGYKAEKLK